MEGKSSGDIVLYRKETHGGITVHTSGFGAFYRNGVHRTGKRKRFLEIVREKWNNIRGALRSDDKERNNECGQLLEKLRDFSIDLLTEEQKLVSVDELEKQITVKITNDYPRIMRIPQVQYVNVAHNNIQVHTDDLYCFNPLRRTVHFIGPFLIIIFFDGENHFGGYVRWFNKRLPLEVGLGGPRQSPHIDKHGYPCLGNLREIIPEYIAKFEFVPLISLAIQFVEKVNVDDIAGRYISCWPEVDEETTEQLVQQRRIRL